MDKNQDSLQVFGELLVQIRGIAGGAAKQGHVSALGGGKFSPESACKAIYALADAAHNLPEVLAMPEQKQALLINGVLEQISDAGKKVFGDRSTLDAFIPAKVGDAGISKPTNHRQEGESLGGSTDMAMLHAALKEAEDELCALGATLTNEGWDTQTIKLTLDVVRIALYGGDGDGQGPEHFEQARNALQAQRVVEAKES